MCHENGEKKPKAGVAATVRALAGPLAEELGLRVWDVQYAKEGAEWVLRIYIDKEGGVGIDDCVDMTHAIDPVLDREDPVPQEYVLEVSSPGVNRRLTRPEHLQAYLGLPVRARLIRPLPDGAKELEGLLLEAGAEGLEIQLDEETSVSLQKKELAWVSALDDPAF
ncbi:ribosome maturation factor RimP [Acutalibacter caecimuris]|uniref:ribosome maturation factor RimP n=1 Tax=Acutalibacter caecimuris TaxID=3093657 RepID=UPI002AC8E857|nr:ribosome maturation factor RimP [Acutalibacter sp. M00118]